MGSTVWSMTMFGGRPRIGDSDAPLEVFFDGLKRIVFFEDRKDVAHIGPGDLAVALGGAAGRTVGALKRSATKLQKMGAVGLVAHEHILDAAPTSMSSLPDGPFPIILIDRSIEWPDVLQPLMRIDAMLRGRAGNSELRRAELVREIFDNEGRIHVDNDAAQEIGLDLDRAMRVIFIATPHDLSEATLGRLEEAIAFELLEHDPSGTVLSETHNVIAVQGGESANSVHERLPAALLARARAMPDVEDITVGTGGGHLGPMGMFRSLREARWAAQVASCLQGPNSAMSFADLGAYAWLEPIEFDQHGNAIAAIETIIERDALQGTRLLETLRVFLETSRLKEAADRLFVHRNTLRYRLDAISRLTGHDLQDPGGRLVLELQLRLAMVRGVVSRAGASQPDEITLVDADELTGVIDLDLDGVDSLS